MLTDFTWRVFEKYGTIEAYLTYKALKPWDKR